MSHADGSPDARGWIVSGPFDLLLFANLWWLAAALPVWLDGFGHSRLEFWQAYFLTTPHRWLTLILVAADPDRRAGRQGLLVALAVLIPVSVLAVHWTTYELTCLALVDYVWNAWHFGAQHGGILRIYARRSQLPSPRWESWALRLMVPYVSLRLAGWTTGWSEDVPVARPAMLVLDALMLIPVVLLLVGECWRGGRKRTGKLVYLASVVGLYGGLLAALAAQATPWVISLTVASAAFHATEYLAIVSYYAKRRTTGGTASMFRQVAARWTQLLLLYVVLLGALGLWADHAWRDTWLAVNLMAAYLHYAYDGVIWKLRQPATAKALGV